MRDGGTIPSFSLKVHLTLEPALTPEPSATH
jgi:hypothetical protein